MQITKENLTIIIVTIKSQNIIDDCLKSIDPSIKKIIVENSSDREFVEYLKKKYENIECYLTGKNLGMGAGNNFGIKKSNTRYVMVLNPDTILKTDTLSQIFEISKNLEFSILSPLSDNKDYPNYKINNKQEKEESDLFEVNQVDGYAMILDKKEFNDNFFDEKIFMYLENDDLCLRAKKNNKKIYIYRNSLISHLGAKAVDEKYFKELEFSRNWHWNWSKFYFRKKHFGFTKAFVSGFFIFFKSIFKSVYFLIINNKFKSKLYYFRASGFINAALNKSSWFRPRLD
ncbi:glycosyltransferase [Pelagibacterales bacterium SAG-MED29]|nr:glycosyltransferase [Pelagibacterales bacterium SAG-MED29]